uniref:Chloride anion exchanger-like n=1 Tax=Gouania willdenowi TaxID=441366 RepID=A0A8C5GRY7_GOUWI
TLAYIHLMRHLNNVFNSIVSSSLTAVLWIFPGVTAIIMLIIISRVFMCTIFHVFIHDDCILHCTFQQKRCSFAEVQRVTPPAEEGHCIYPLLLTLLNMIFFIHYHLSMDFINTEQLLWVKIRTAEILPLHRYESPMAPNLPIFQETAVEAFPMAIVGFAVAFSVAKVYSVKHDYTIDGNQELIAFGVSNIFGASFKSFAASTALSRSAVQESTGGKTQVAGLISALIVMIVTLAIGFLLEPLPKSVLGAVVIVNLKSMLMQVREIPYLWRRDKPDCVVWLATCVAAVLLGLDLGLAAGLGVELLSVVLRVQFPRCSVLANIKGTDVYKDRKDFINIYEPDGVMIFRIPSPLFFANIEFFRSKLLEALGFNPLRVLRKRNKALRRIRRLLKKGCLQWTSEGFLNTSFGPIADSKEEENIKELDLPTDFKDLPARINWNAELPANIVVPRVDIHSLVLDFAAVSFLDISALKGLKTVLKELIRIEVMVYIVACDPYVLQKLHDCCFFDDEVQSSMFFLTLHDAMLHILEKHPEATERKADFGKVTNCLF